MVWLTGLVVAALVGAALSRQRISPWWAFGAAVVAGALALVTSSDAASCDGPSSADAVFGYAGLIATGLFATAAFAALFDAVSLARRGEARRAAWRVAPLLLSVALGIGTFILWIATLLACLD
jgi:hypothetical protein